MFAHHAEGYQTLPVIAALKAAISMVSLSKPAPVRMEPTTLH
jgi:hypothetical protein